MTENVNISVIVAVRNEAHNIRRCLTSLAPANEVIVVDSHSTDATAQIAEEEFGRTVVQFDYTGKYPKKRQWAMDNCEFRNDWLLLIDADEVVTKEQWVEIAETLASPSHDAYLLEKQFHFLGRRFRYGGFSHQAVLLVRRGAGRFEETMAELSSGLDMEVHERLIVSGRVGRLSEPLIHEDFKGLKAYIDRHNAYSTWEAQLRYEYLNTGTYAGDAIRPDLFGDAQSRRRYLKHIVMRLPFEAVIWFLYHYIIRLGFLEGRPGLIASQLRAGYIRDVRSKLFELEHAQENSTRP